MVLAAFPMVKSLVDEGSAMLPHNQNCDQDGDQGCGFHYNHHLSDFCGIMIPAEKYIAFPSAQVPADKSMNAAMASCRA